MIHFLLGILVGAMATIVCCAVYIVLLVLNTRW